MKHQRWWILAGVFVMLGVFVGTMSWPSDVLARPLTVNENLQPADVIIVLGAGTRRGADPIPTQAKLRTNHGVELWKSGFAPRVIISGGKSKVTGLIESEIMGDYAVQRGLDSNRLLLEKKSTSTRENAEESLKIMSAESMTSAIVVTSSYHTWRACKVFRWLKASVQCAAATIHAPAENQYDRLVNFRSVVREYGAIVLYAIRGYL